MINYCSKDYCTNDECKNKNKCPIHHYVNEKVTNKFFQKKYNPKDCEYSKGDADVNKR